MFYVFSTAHAQSFSYPISQLDNCRDGKECYLYCQIPTHTPACWSYGKYVLPQVLGEETSSLEDQAKAANISFPIAELGNCQSALACFTYCSQTKNQSTCRDFARKNGLAKEEQEDEQDTKVTSEIIQSAQAEIGCNSRENCQAVCSQPENLQKCREFAIKHNLQKEDEGKGPSTEVINSAKQELGCTDQSSCSSFCSQNENKEKCHNFAKKHKLIDEEKEKTEWEHEQEKRQKLVEEAHQTLGCSSLDECKVYCSAPEHNAACREFSRKHAAENQITPTPTNKPPLPCESEEACRQYCSNNPDQCKGYKSAQLSVTPSQSKSDSGKTSISKQPEESVKPTGSTASGNYLGPGGCRTTSECKAYCEKHPTQCPGFPKVSPTTKPTSTAKRGVNASSSERISVNPSRTIISPTIKTESDPTKILYNLRQTTEITTGTTNGSSQSSSGPSSSSGGGFGTSSEDK